MDARITKQRLGNLLSYDWLKILLSVVAAVAVLAVFFTMVGTRPTSAQTFTVFCHEELSAGSDFNTLADTLEKKEVFSYDILSVGTESFSGGSSTTIFNTRRSVGEGTVYFVPNEEPKYLEKDGEPVLGENGKPIIDEKSNQLIYLSRGVVYNGESTQGDYFDTVYFLKECENYLSKFYSENGELDGEAVRKCFLERNGNDKRFRSKAKKEAGVLQEQARIEKLREDYLFVKSAFEGDTLSHIAYEMEDGNTYNFGVSLAGLKGLGKLVNYGTEGSAPVSLMILRNNYRDNNLRYETVSFLRYLVEKYKD